MWRWDTKSYTLTNSFPRVSDLLLCLYKSLRCSQSPLFSSHTCQPPLCRSGPHLSMTSKEPTVYSLHLTQTLLDAEKKDHKLFMALWLPSDACLDSRTSKIKCKPVDMFCHNLVKESVSFKNLNRRSSLGELQGGWKLHIAASVWCGFHYCPARPQLAK